MATRPDSSVPCRAPSVVAGPNRRCAEKPESPRLCAEPRKKAAVEEKHVVGVEAVEASRGSLAGQVRVGEDPDPAQALVQPGPVAVVQPGGSPDVEVDDPERAEIPDVRSDAADGSAAIRLHMNGDRETMELRHGEHPRQPLVLARATPPPRHDHGRDAGVGDLPHLRGQHERIGRGVGASDGVVVGGDLLWRRVAALLPVRVRAVARGGPEPGVVEDRRLGCGQRLAGSRPARVSPRGGRHPQAGRNHQDEEPNPHRRATLLRPSAGFFPFPKVSRGSSRHATVNTTERPVRAPANAIDDTPLDSELHGA